MPDQEDTEQVAGVTEGATAPEDSSYEDVLSGEGTTPKDGPSGEPDKATTDSEAEGEKQDEKPAQEDPDIQLEIGGKFYSGKQSEILELLENHQKLVEKEKSLNRDYTQKTQALAETRKSFEQAFGRMPEPQEIQNLGKLWQAYYENPKAAQMIESILKGNLEALSEATNQNKQTPDAYTQSLETKIASLENKLTQFTSSIEQREQAQIEAESKKTWDGWVSKMAGQKVQITEEIDEAMTPFIEALSKKHPDWDDNKVLDEAYRYATIDKQHVKIASKILIDADQAKKNQPPKITPKSTQKSESEKSYAELVTN